MVSAAPPAPLAAVVCEDDAVVGAALVDTLNGAYRFDVVAAVGSGPEAVAATARTAPDVVVVDLALAGEAGLGIVAALRSAAPGCAVVVVVPAAFVRLRAAAEAAGAAALVGTDDLRPLRRVLEQAHRRTHARACPACPATRPPPTAAAAGGTRLRVGPSPAVRPGTEAGTGRPPSSPTGAAFDHTSDQHPKEQT